MRHALLAILAILLLPAFCFAWGYKEHIQIARLAVERIIADPAAPEDLKTWLKSNFPNLMTMDQEKDYFLHEHIGLDPSKYKGMAYWVCVPDLRSNDDAWKNKKIPPFNAPERKNHFLDMEYLQPDVERRAYKHDLSNRLPIDQFPRDAKNPLYLEAGFLPFAMENNYNLLVQSIKENHLAPDPANPKDENHAVHYAGYLMHYLGDSFQPLHSTIDYKCSFYFANKRTFPNVHAEFEWRMNDDEKEFFPELREEFWKAFEEELKVAKDDADLSDMWKMTVRQCYDSYQYIPMIGVAAQQASKQAGTPLKPFGPSQACDTVEFYHYIGTVDGQRITLLQLKARLQAKSVVRIQRVILQAWKQAHS